MTTTSGCSMPLRQPYKRASFSAVSLASAPELLKNARSIPDSSVSRLASCCCQSMLYRFDVCSSNPACSLIAETIRGCEWPTLVTATPATASRYSRPA
ncbi:hypothetical protein D3C78_1819730 [compost metagenome]